MNEFMCLPLEADGSENSWVEYFGRFWLWIWGSESDSAQFEGAESSDVDSAPLDQMEEFDSDSSAQDQRAFQEED